MKTSTKTPPSNPFIHMVTESLIVATMEGETMVNTLYPDPSGRLFFLVKGVKHFVPDYLVL